jgi:hypothetical protein
MLINAMVKNSTLDLIEFMVFPLCSETAMNELCANQLGGAAVCDEALKTRCGTLFKRFWTQSKCR